MSDTPYAWPILQLILSFILVIVGIFNKDKWATLNHRGKFGAVIAIIFALGVGINGYVGVAKQKAKDKKEALLEKINQSFGDIEDLNGASIPKMCFGDSDNSLTPTNNGTIITDGQQPHLRVYIKENKLFVTAIINNLKGEAVTALYNNEWTMYDKDNFEYNNNDTAYEVVSKGLRRVILRVVLTNGVAHIHGGFFNNIGIGIYIGSENGAGRITAFRGTKDESLNDIPYIKLFFKYPRDRYYGVVDTAKYSP